MFDTIGHRILPRSFGDRLIKPPLHGRHFRLEHRDVTQHPVGLNLPFARAADDVREQIETFEFSRDVDTPVVRPVLDRFRLLDQTIDALRSLEPSRRFDLTDCRQDSLGIARWITHDTARGNHRAVGEDDVSEVLRVFEMIWIE